MWCLQAEQTPPRLHAKILSVLDNSQKTCVRWPIFPQSLQQTRVYSGCWNYQGVRNKKYICLFYSIYFHQLLVIPDWQFTHILTFSVLSKNETLVWVLLWTESVTSRRISIPSLHIIDQLFLNPCSPTLPPLMQNSRMIHVWRMNGLEDNGCHLFTCRVLGEIV